MSVPIQAFALTSDGWMQLKGGTFVPSAGGVVTFANEQIAALSEGQQLATMQFTLAGNHTANIALRATVHHAIRRVFVPTSTLTLETGRTDRVLTVYAQFAAVDGTLSTVDVTGHPYLRYAVASATASSNLSVNATGRVTTGSQPGPVRITISIDPAIVKYGPTVFIDVEVVAPLEDRPILTALHTGTAIRKRSILLLSEGFASQDQPLFDGIASDLASRLMRDVSPYNLLRESFDIYSAFVASQESGATIGPPVVALAGAPGRSVVVPPDEPLAPGDSRVEDLLNALGNPAGSPTLTLAAAQAQAGHLAFSQITFDAWRSLTPAPPQARVRETAFGLMIGERHYGTKAWISSAPTIDVGLALLLPSQALPNRTPHFDERRLPDLTTTLGDDSTAHVAMQDRFVQTLRAADGAAGFGAVWATGGDSFGLVVYVINCDHYGGLHQEGYVGMSIGGGAVLSVVPSTVVDGLLDVVPVPRPIAAAQQALGFRTRSPVSIADTLAHELGHTTPMGSLNDEYADGRGMATGTTAVTFIERSPNTQVLANARAGNGAAIIDTLLKWNWERVEAAASVATLSGSGTSLTIGLTTEDMVRWPTNTIGRTVFLRTRLGTISGPGPQENGLIVQAVDIGAQTIQVQLPTPSAVTDITLYAANGIIVMPLIDSTTKNAQRLVAPAVIAAMSTGPFSPSSNQGTGCSPNPAQGPPATITGFSFPGNQNQLLAAYESAAGFECGAIRPAAECKMRTVADQPSSLPVDFCFVCKYVMVECTDPASHSELDRTSYPR